MGTYEIAETKTLDGLVLNTTKYEVKFEQKDLTTKIYETKLDISNLLHQVMASVQEVFRESNNLDEIVVFD